MIRLERIHRRFRPAWAAIGEVDEIAGEGGVQGEISAAVGAEDGLGRVGVGYAQPELGGPVFFRVPVVCRAHHGDGEEGEEGGEEG